MTALTEFFCNFCNPSAQRRDEGDELNRGYARVVDGALPQDWEEAPGVGPGRVGHKCPHCIKEGKGSPPVFNVAPERTHDSGWPSRTSPFGAQVG